jgi:hypothetical protein
LNYRAYFAISDLSQEIDSIALKVEFAKDKYGNWSNAYVQSNFIELDTKNPELIALFANDYSLITGETEFTNLLVFNESMAAFNAPSMSFSDAFISTSLLTEDALNSYWMNPETYQLSFTLNSVDYQNEAVSTSVLGATDAAGNSVQFNEHLNYCTFNLSFAALNELSNKRIVLYPNPYSITSETLKMEGDLGQLEVITDIYSLDGKMVQSVLFKSSDGVHFESISIDLSAGIYRIHNTELGINLPLIIQN